MTRKRATSLEVDRLIAQLAQRPHGVFTNRELLAAGMAWSCITDRVAVGLLHRLHRGVYSTVPPHLLKIEGHWLAAVYACGPDAALSHASGAALLDLRAIPSGPIHVTIPSRAGRRRRPGIMVHRSSTLLASDITVEDFIPVTTPARTLADLRRTLSRPQYLAALRRAEKRGLDTGLVPERLDDLDRTELERRMLALCRRHGISLPLTQQIIGPYTVDFLWPEAALVVETDGWGAHGTRSAFESDRERDAWLVAQGFRVIRFTWLQLTREGPRVAATLRRILDGSRR
jgi:very-short-patch-repair endonuclease